MKNLIILAIGLATALPCAFSQNTNVTFDLDPFDRFEVTLNATVEVSEGARQSVTITGPELLIHEINTNIQDGNWDIKYPDGKSQDRGSFQINIVVTSLKSLAVSGNAKIRAKGQFSRVSRRNIAISGTGAITFAGDADHTQIALSGSGYLDIEANGDLISCALSGSGDIDLNGTTKDLKVVTSGSGNVGGNRLKTNNCKIIMSGSSIVTAHIVDKVEMTVSGSGRLDYKGNPRIHQKNSGGGSCTKKVG